MRLVLWLSLLLTVSDVWAQEDVLTWERCVALTAQHNYDLKEALTKFGEAEGQATLYRAVYYPRLSAEALTIPATLAFRIEQVLYNRAVLPRQRIGNLGKEAARINLELTLRDVFFRLRRAYVRALYALRVEKLQADYAEQLGRLTRSAPDLFAAGKLTKASVIRYEVRTDLAKNEVQQAHNRAIQARIDLDEIIGVTLTPPPRLAGEFSTEVSLALNLQELTAEAYLKRRDLQLLENTRHTEFEKVLVASSTYYPELELFNNTSFQPPGARFGTEIDPTSNDDQRFRDRHNSRSQFDVGLNFSWRVFDGFETYGQKKAAVAILQTREEALRSLRNVIPAQVQVAVTSVIHNQQILDSFKEGPSAAILKGQADEQFSSGKATSLDLLDTEDKILTQNLTRLAALRDLELSLNQLQFAVGRDVELVVGPVTNSPVKP